jgi:hypothetical protein
MPNQILVPNEILVELDPTKASEFAAAAQREGIEVTEAELHPVP